MKRNALIAVGALAAAGLGAGIAQAAPDVTSIEVNKVGGSSHGKVEVVVEAARGTTTIKPQISATIGPRTRSARTINWSSATSPTDTVTYVAKFKHSRIAAGTTVTVTLQACDTTCATIVRDVTVLRSSAARSRVGRAVAPLPAGSVDATQAGNLALASVGAGSTLIEVERADEHAAAWEVKVLRTDGARLKVYVAADGTIIATRVEGLHKGRKGRNHPEDRVLTPLPAGSATVDQAVNAALANVGPGSTLILVKREDDPGVAYEVKVRRADGVRFEVQIAADGSVVSSRMDD